MQPVPYNAEVAPNPKFMMSLATREVICWYPGVDFASMGYTVFNGNLPPMDFASGLRIAPVRTVVERGDEFYEPENEDERIERIAAIIPLVKEEDRSEKGVPGIPALEKLSGVKVSVADRNKALKLIVDKREEKAREKNEKILADGGAVEPQEA